MRMRRQVMAWEKIYAKETADKELLSKTYKELLKHNKKKTTQLKNRPKTLTIHQMANEHMKRCSTSYIIQFSSVQSLSRVRLFATPERQHVRPRCPSPTPEVHPNSCPLNRWCHPTISSSAVHFSSCPQSFPASGSFQMSQLLASGGQSIGVSASTSVLSMNT